MATTTPFDRTILDRFINDTIPSSLRDELYQPTPRQDTSQSLEMGHYERLFWVLIFSVMVLIAAGGNTIVVYIVSTNKEMKSVTNYFLVNLSLADTMVSTLNVIFNFISMLISHWPFGLIYCKISNFIAILSISASVFTLTAISCDRYNAILHPLRPRMSHSHAIGWILLIWTLSSALALPNLIFSTLVEDRLVDDDVAGICVNVWSDGKYPHSRLDLIYNIVVLVVTYLVPILTMAILYYQVGKELWGYEAIGENVEKQQRAILAKRKIVKMMIVVVIIFALCWLPYHAFFVINFYVPILQDEPLQYIRCYLFIYWLAMSNSMYNPIIIYFMNSNFRQEFKKILCLLFCCSTYTPPSRANNNANNINNNINNNNNNTNTNTNNNNINSNNNNNTRNHTHVKKKGATSLAQETASNLKKTLNIEKDTHYRHNANQQEHSDRIGKGKDMVEVVVTSPSSRQLNVIDQHRTVINRHNKQKTINFSADRDNCAEDEPFILHKLNGIQTNMTVDLKQQDGEKLIDFSTANMTNGDKHNLTDNDDDDDDDDDDVVVSDDRIGKVWI